MKKINTVTNYTVKVLFIAFLLASSIVILLDAFKNGSNL